MTEEYLTQLHKIPSMNTAIISSITLTRSTNEVAVNLITDKAFSEQDEEEIKSITSKFIPEEFSFAVNITKLTPDARMVEKKILQIIAQNNKALSALISEDDVKAERTDDGFYFTIAVMRATAYTGEIADSVAKELKKHFCGEFRGKSVNSEKAIDSIEVEEEHENIEYIVPIRTFAIEDFKFLEGTEVQKNAVYMADMNFESENVTVCGNITDIQERQYKRNNGLEKTYYSFTISDTTATMRATYFTRQKSIEKIKKLKVGDSIVCTGKSETFHGSVRFTANFIDLGKMPEGFVPEKRQSKPAPKYYSVVKPEPFVDFAQTDLFTKDVIPDCLKQNTFVVFDLETTGLNSSPSQGNMDKIIEIGAYKVIDGVIKESFTTFIDPQRKLSEEIINLTGIKPEMVAGAPTYEQAMPDFFKFCQGSYLVGHNIAGFDFKFVDYYCAQLGYMLERNLFDTLALSQEMLFLPNYKLNTVADHFGITFNHHRAIDDALVTAKIFIELIKLKKSLPKPC